jgi:ring-1,2-phenylacetyl-CoA epoxidase subunit PaaE
MAQFHTLKIQSIVRQTEKAVSITFDVPSSLKTMFNFKAGQYITLKAVINEAEIRRDYSLSSSPKSGDLTVTIKEIEGGVFSTYANKSLNIGDSLEVGMPNGRFIYESQSEDIKSIVAFAAGSGITPIMSIARTVLEAGNDNVVLIYGNKSPEKTIFYKEILELQSAYLNRFKVQFVYSESNNDGALFGRIDVSNINYVIKNTVQLEPSQLFYLCGPEGMIKTTTAILSEKGVHDKRILFELFTASSAVPTSSGVVREGESEITMLVDEEETTLVMPQNQTILEAALANDVEL